MASLFCCPLSSPAVFSSSSAVANALSSINSTQVIMIRQLVQKMTSNSQLLAISLTLANIDE